MADGVSRTRPQDLSTLQSTTKLMLSVRHPPHVIARSHSVGTATKQPPPTTTIRLGGSLCRPSSIRRFGI
jgi:hypothetical protein